MLYFYTQISHPINNMHQYMDYFFIRLFGEASSTYNHTSHIHPDFQSIIDSHNVLDKKLEEIFNAFNGLPTPSDKLKIQKAYYINNDITEVCEKKLRPIKYDELHVDMRKCLKDLYGSEGMLYKMLTSKKDYQAIKNRCGSLKGHFEKFRGANLPSICPFCGMENLLTDYDELKNEYDHYLSKGDYPFCSINFNNLVPVCDYCNKGGNKGQKDIPFLPKSKPQVQEELYFPYCTACPDHEIVLSINSANTDLKDINNWTLNIDCIPAHNANRKDRWAEIYNIESRYKSKIANDSYQWKDRIISKHALRCKKKGIPFDDFKEDILDDFKEYRNYNNGIMMKCFDEFIINDPNCESYLTGHLVI